MQLFHTMTKYILLLFLLFSTITSSAQSKECDCQNRVYINYDKADFVFNGKVLKRLSHRLNGNNVIQFRVYQMIKGKQTGETVAIMIPCLTTDCCGILFEKGKRYQVYARLVDGNYLTYLCSETKEL